MGLHLGHRGRRRIASVVAALAIAPAGLAAAAPASPPAGVVVQVDRSAPITHKSFDHWLRIAAISAGHTRAPRPGEKGYGAQRDETLQFLISARWIQGEAAERGIRVSRAHIVRSYRQTRRRAFPSDKSFRRFLRRSGMTVEDILFRVQLDDLSSAIRHSVLQGVSHDQQQAALDNFVGDFRDKWKSRTTCAEGYITDDCGNE